MRERFDETFYEEVNSFMGTAFGDYELDAKLKDFIEQEISLAISEREREIIESIQNVMITYKYWAESDEYDQGLHDMKEEIISSLTKPSLSQGGDNEEK